MNSTRGRLVTATLLAGLAIASSAGGRLWRSFDFYAGDLPFWFWPALFAISWIAAYAWCARMGPWTPRWHLVSVGLGVLLIAFLFTTLAIPFKGKSKVGVCMMRLESLHAALSEYATKYEGRLPPAEAWRQAVRPYAGDHVEDVTVCPITGKPYVLNPLLAGRPLKAVRDPERAPLLWDDPDRMHAPHEGLFSVCFADGHVQGFVPSKYKEVITGQKGDP